APAVVDTLGGHIPMVVTPLSEALPHVREGRLRMLATTGLRRSKAMPDVPTLYELGYKDVIFQDWSGFLAPAGMPADLVARANSAVQEVLKQEKVVQAMANLGSEPEFEDPAEFAATVKASWERYRDIVASTGFKAEE